MLITEKLLLAMLLFFGAMYIVGKIADHTLLRPSPPEIKRAWASNAGHLRSIPIKPLPWTTLPEQRARERGTTGFIGRQIPQPMQTSTETACLKDWIDEWRGSVLLLVKWGERNMSDARLRLEVGDYRSALDTASTGIERMARALLRCFGEKADIESGQIEPLRLVSLRLTRQEMTEFEATVEVVAKFHQNMKALKIPSTTGTDMAILDAKTVISLCDSASNIVTLFAKTLHEHFAAEIPDLRECCPKCFSIDVASWGFNQLATSCTCNLCKHKWTEPQNKTQGTTPK